MQSIAREVADLVGKQYQKGGRGPKTYDCAGLVIEVQRRLGRMNDIPETPDGDIAQATSMQRILRTRWRQVEAPEIGCVVLLKPAHVGIIVERRRFLHTEEGEGRALIEDLHSPRWKRKIGGYFVPLET